MKDANQQEKRKHTRVKFEGEVTIHQVRQSVSENILEVDGEPIKVKLDDFSEAGLRLDLGDTQHPTEILKVKFSVKKFKTVDGYAKLTWKMGSNCGFRFIVLDKDSREQIENYIAKKKNAKSA